MHDSRLFSMVRIIVLRHSMALAVALAAAALLFSDRLVGDRHPGPAGDRGALEGTRHVVCWRPLTGFCNACQPIECLQEGGTDEAAHLRNPRGHGPDADARACRASK